MKAKSIFAVSLFMAGAAFADTTTVETEYVLGVLPVSISGNQVILSIPWIESGRDVDGIAVSNLVKTAGLTDGDNLLWYNPADEKFEAWEVDGNEWKAVSSVSDLEKTKVETGSTALLRGQAVILRRDSASSTTIYIVGGEGSDVTKQNLTVSAGKQALFAPPEVTTVSDLKAYLGSHVSNSNVGDEVIISPSEKLVYRPDPVGWKYYTTTDNWETFSTEGTPSLVAGKGLIYVNKGLNNVGITF